MGRPTHFEIHGTAPEALVSFYSELLGWRANRWGSEDYWMLETGDGPGINGAIIQRRGPAPEVGAPIMGATLVADVTAIDATLVRALELGAAMALDKMAIPGTGWVAYVSDPDNNVFGLFQADAEAK